MGGHREGPIAAVALALLTTTAAGALAPHGSPDPGGAATDPLPCGDRVPHPPIVIRGDAMFKLGPTVGVTNPTAAGTAEDPYVIEEWCIALGHEDASGIRIEDTTSHVAIRDNRIDGAPAGVQTDRDYGISLEESDNVTIHGNTITGIPYSAIEVDRAQDLQVTDNTVTGNGFTAVSLYRVDRVLLANNTVTDNDSYDVRLDDSTEATMTNNTLGPGGVEISGERLSHKQHAIDASNTVNGEPLRYVRDETGVEVAKPAGQVILVNTTGARVEGLDLTGTISPLQLWDTDQTTVAGNEIAHSDEGVLVADGDQTRVTNNTITLNPSNATSARFFGTKTGVSLSANESRIDNNTIRDNEEGIYLGLAPGALIENNEIVHNEERGVLLFSDRVHLDHNTIRHSRTGVQVGLDPYTAAEPLLTDNRITHNGDGLYIERSSQPELHGNDIADNEKVGLRAFSLRTVDATNNWWGAPSGPSGGVEDDCTGTIADGEGDAIEGGSLGRICFDPWLTEPNPDAGVG